MCERVSEKNEVRHVETENRHVETENRRVEAENRRVEAENRHVEAENRRSEAENRRVEAENQHVEAETRHVETENRAPHVNTQPPAAAKLHIRTFGEFALSCGDRVLSADKVKSRQAWALLEYLVGNRDMETGRERLMEELWDGESDDPANALKNLAYRVRSMFRDFLGLDGSRYIVSVHGSYCWDKTAEVEVDADAFEALVKSADPRYVPEGEVLEKCLKAIELYKGSYMPQSEHKAWVMHRSVYYHNLFAEAVAKAGAILQKSFQYRRLEEINRLAVAADKYSEENHANIIIALHGQGKTEQALAHYDRVSLMLRSDLGVEPTEVITNLYEMITDTGSHGEKDAEMLARELREQLALQEKEERRGASECSYDTLKAVFCVMCRVAERQNRSVQALLITLRPCRKKKHFEENPDQVAGLASRLICRTLRKNDVVARCAKYQYAVLLYDTDRRGAAAAGKRIKKAFKADPECDFLGIGIECAVMAGKAD